jgi:hypothetical protein
MFSVLITQVKITHFLLIVQVNHAESRNYSGF